MRFSHNGGGRTVFRIVKVSVYIQNIPYGDKRLGECLLPYNFNAVLLYTAIQGFISCFQRLTKGTVSTAC